MEDEMEEVQEEVENLDEYNGVDYDGGTLPRDFFCDSCGHDEEFNDEFGEAESAAEYAGWIIDGEGGNICPRCQW